MLLYQVGREMPCGYAELNTLRDSTCHLWVGHVIIDPAQRGRGLGRRLVQMLVEHALADQAVQRLTMVVFPDNVAALGCYDAIGFRIVGREHHRFASDNEKHTMLRLELTRRRARTQSLTLAAGQ